MDDKQAVLSNFEILTQQIELEADFTEEEMSHAGAEALRAIGIGCSHYPAPPNTEPTPEAERWSKRWNEMAARREARRQNPPPRKKRRPKKRPRV